MAEQAVGTAGKIRTGILIAGLMWFAIALFGTVFDTGHRLIIASLMVLGFVHLGIYFFSRPKS